jgi:hypothetical protein
MKIKRSYPGEYHITYGNRKYLVKKTYDKMWNLFDITDTKDEEAYTTGPEDNFVDGWWTLGDAKNMIRKRGKK